MNVHEQRIADRKARLVARAANAATKSGVVYNRAMAMAAVIPMGQPVLVGHHSEKRDRRFRAKIHNTFGKAFALQEKASYYADKAVAV